MAEDKDASGTGNGDPAGGGKTEARKEAEAAWAEREKIIKEAQEKHGGKKGDGKK